jgi:hypothetical protein
MIITAASQHVEGIELGFLIMPARMQSCEARLAVDAEHHRFTVDDELLVQLQRGLDNPWKRFDKSSLPLVIRRTAFCSRITLIR